MEVLIALTLLTLIIAAISQTTINTFKVRDRILRDGDFYNNVRFAVGLLERDFVQLYSPLKFMPEEKKSGSGSRRGGMGTPVYNVNPDSENPGVDPEITVGELSIGNEYWGPAIHKLGVRPSRLVGDAGKLTFIAVSNMRIYRDSRESVFLKVSYSLQDDPTPNDKIKEPGANRVLIRSTNSDAFSPEIRRDHPSQEATLLRGIKQFKFRYWDKARERWEDKWDSEKEGNRYPMLLEVTFEVYGTETLSTSGRYVFRSEIPWNALPQTF